MIYYDLPNFLSLVYPAPGVDLVIREKYPPFEPITNPIVRHNPWIMLTGSTVIASFVPVDHKPPQHANHILIEDLVGRPPFEKDGELKRGREWVTLLTWMKYDLANGTFTKTMDKPFRTLHNGQSLDIDFEGRHYGKIKRVQDILEI